MKLVDELVVFGRSKYYDEAVYEVRSQVLEYMEKGWQVLGPIMLIKSADVILAYQTVVKYESTN